VVVGRLPVNQRAADVGGVRHREPTSVPGAVVEHRHRIGRDALDPQLRAGPRDQLGAVEDVHVRVVVVGVGAQVVRVVDVVQAQLDEPFGGRPVGRVAGRDVVLLLVTAEQHRPGVVVHVPVGLQAIGGLERHDRGPGPVAELLVDMLVGVGQVLLVVVLVLVFPVDREPELDQPVLDLPDVLVLIPVPQMNCAHGYRESPDRPSAGTSERAAGRSENSDRDLRRRVQ
jgi:hypothetical protein